MTQPVRYHPRIGILSQVDTEILAIFDSNTATPAFTISRPPSPQDNLQLSRDFLSQDKHQRSKDRSCIAEFTEGSGFRGGLHARNDVCNTYQRTRKTNSSKSLVLRALRRRGALQDPQRDEGCP